MEYIILMIAIIAIIYISSYNMGKGTRVSDGDFEIRALSTNGIVDLILEKSKKEQEGIVFIPNGITIIGKEVFLNHTKITDIKIDPKTKIIGYSAFKNCSNIKYLYTGEGTESIGEEAFYGCHGLVEIKIGPRIKKINLKAFYECPNLLIIIIDSLNVPEIFSNSFDDKTKKSGILYVHPAKIEEFRSSPFWKDFKNIKIIAQSL